MLAIKLQRIGKKHQPSYRVVVAEKRSKMAAPPVEDVGSYNPFTKTVHVNAERVRAWIQNGAQPTATVFNLLVQNGVLEGPKMRIAVRRKKADESAALSPSASPTAETPREDKAEASASPESAAAQ